MQRRPPLRGARHRGDAPATWRHNVLGMQYVVLDAAGRLVSASEGARAWLDNSRADLLGELARAADRGHNDVGWSRQVPVTLVPMNGGSQTHYLAVLPSALPDVPAATRLTPTQHKVAQDAADGLTVEAIAQRQHISPNTVKFHLKAIYERLGVTSRAELARALRG